MLSRVFPIGKITISATGVFTLVNRRTTIQHQLPPDVAERYRRYLVAYGKKKFTSVRLTGLFKTKKPGLFVGSVALKDLGDLIAKIKEAREKELGLTFFAWKNDPERYKGEGTPPALNLTVDVERPREERSTRRPIQADPFEDDAIPSEKKTNDPFGLD